MLSLLYRHNFVVYDCPTAADAMTKLAEHSHIRLVITDNALPDMTGTQFISGLRKAFSKEQLAIIGLANDQRPLMSAHFIKSGANDFLHLPFCHEEFLCRVMQNIEYIESVEAIRRAANTDYLTGLPNRRHFFYIVTVQYQQLRKEHALALIDLDFFKQINDTYGHDGGDSVLKTVALLIEEHFPNEIFARFGGEEFCVYMPSTDACHAHTRLNEFRQAVEKTKFQILENNVSVTCSVGVSSTPTQNIETLLTQADKQLYEAKHAGRNRVSCFPLQSGS